MYIFRNNQVSTDIVKYILLGHRLVTGSKHLREALIEVVVMLDELSFSIGIRIWFNKTLTKS